MSSHGRSALSYGQGSRVRAEARRERAVVRAVGLVVVLLSTRAAWAQLPPVPVPPENPITEPKRVLGKILFWDEQLASDNTVACGTCHRPEFNGADPRRGRHPGLDGIANTPDDKIASPGVVRSDADGVAYADPVFGLEPQVGTRSAMPALGAMYAPELFWDGRAPAQFLNPQTGAVSIANGGALESQAVGPILNDVEMAHEERDWDEVAAKLAASRPLRLARDIPPDVAAVLAGGPTYPELFTAAFGDGEITAERIAFSLATYERTLVADQTPWDAFMGGNLNALTPPQRGGWNFFRTSQCAICHAPPLFTNHTFRNIGLRPVAEDPGRQEVTGVPADRGRFKVPSLRNVGLKETFMHTGQLASIPQVLEFYLAINGQVQFPDNRDPLIPQIAIPPQVFPQLVDFLTNGLTDPRVANGEFPFDRPTLYSERLVAATDFAACLAGPERTPAPAAPRTAQACLAAFDADTDGDVDARDFARLQETLVGD